MGIIETLKVNSSTLRRPITFATSTVRFLSGNKKKD